MVKRRNEQPERDDLLEAAYEQWPNIRMMYVRFQDKKPVMLLDIQEQRIYAYPYAAFRRDLSKLSQRLLKQQYGKAVDENKMVVFVRDNERRRLVSFLLDWECTA